jgi:hypothetical protein
MENLQTQILQKFSGEKGMDRSILHWLRSCHLTILTLTCFDDEVVGVVFCFFFW